MTRRIPILLYHSISSDSSPWFRPWTLSEEAFAAQMQYLADQGYRPMTIRQLVEPANREDPQAFSGQSLVITFDDGFADFYTNALPVLQRFDFPATIFLSTAYIESTATWLSKEGEGSRPMLNWDQIREIASAGIECGSHGFSHRQLDTLPSRELCHEIIHSRQILKQHIGSEVVSFAYPHGYHDKGIKRLVAEAGYQAACAVKEAVSSPEDDRYALCRITIHAETTLATFQEILDGHGYKIGPQPECLTTKAWRFVRRTKRVLTGLSNSSRTWEEQR